MLSDNLINPFNMDARDELPHEAEDKPNWIECYYFFSYDRDTGYSVSVHYAREPSDPDIWRVLLGIYLPDGGLLVGRYFGRDGAEDGPGAGPMQTRCLEPMRRWSLQFDGLLEISDNKASTHHLHENAVLKTAKFDLVFEGVAPMWDLHASGLDKGFVFTKEGSEKQKTHHWEQIGKMTGTVTLGRDVLYFNGVGNRDHSFGPRDYTPFEGSIWVNALFPSGKAMMLMGVRIAGKYIPAGYIFRNDGSPLEVIKILESPMHEGDEAQEHSQPASPLADPAHRHFRLVSATEAGNETMLGEFMHVMSSTNFSPSHELMGTGFFLNQRALQFNECAVRYSWNGELGAGHFERIIPISKLYPVESIR